MTITQKPHPVRTRIILVGAALLALLALGLGPATSSAIRLFEQSAVPAGFVYVNNNVPGTNTVTGFARRPDGSPTPLPGSPFAIGCCGTGSAVGSQDGL